MLGTGDQSRPPRKNGQRKKREWLSSGGAAIETGGVTPTGGSDMATGGGISTGGGDVGIGDTSTTGGVTSVELDCDAGMPTSGAEQHSGNGVPAGDGHHQMLGSQRVDSAEGQLGAVCTLSVERRPLGYSLVTEFVPEPHNRPSVASSVRRP